MLVVCIGTSNTIGAAVGHLLSEVDTSWPIRPPAEFLRGRRALNGDDIEDGLARGGDDPALERDVAELVHADDVRGGGLVTADVRLDIGRKGRSVTLTAQQQLAKPRCPRATAEGAWSGTRACSPTATICSLPSRPRHLRHRPSHRDSSPCCATTVDRSGPPHRWPTAPSSAPASAPARPRAVYIVRVGARRKAPPLTRVSGGSYR